jgi:tRNA 2-thiouridine synthesizing protein A
LEATRETAGLRQTLKRLRGRACADCRGPLCDHLLLCATALGLKDAPRCPACAARGLSRSLETVRDDLARWLRTKDCYAQVWLEADDRFCTAPCAWAGLLCVSESGEGLGAEEEFDTEKTVETGKGLQAEQPFEIPAILHDFGDMACGELVLELRRRMRDLPAGTTLRVIATDRAAPQDIPSWARLCGHTLLAAHPPHYDLRKRLEG